MSKKSNYKFYTVYTFMVLFLLILSFNVYATKSTDYAGKVVAEYPARVSGFEPFQVKVTINDPDIMRCANRIYVSDYSYFNILGEGEEYYLSDTYSQNISYNGEKELIFTLINSRAGPLSYAAYNQSVTLQFRYVPDGKPAPTRKDGSVLSSEEIMGDIPISMQVVNYSVSMNLAEGTKKASYNTQEYMFADRTIPGDNTQYRYDVRIMRYGYSLDKGMASYTGVDWKFKLDNIDYKTHFEKTTTSGYISMNMFDKPSEAKKLPITKVGTIEVKDAYYRTYSSVYDIKEFVKDVPDMVQVTVMAHGQVFFERAFVNFALTKTAYVEKGNEQAMISSTEAEFLSQMQSYTIIREPVEELNLVANNKKEKTKDLVVFGTIADADFSPMPYMNIAVKIKDKFYFNETTKTGDFRIELTDVELDETDIIEAMLYSMFEYKRDGKTVYDIKFLDVADNRYEDVYIMKKFNITDKNTELHVVFDNSTDPTLRTSKGVKTYEQVRSLSVIYSNMHEAVEFSLTKLNANIDYKLPVTVWVGNAEKKTLYSPDNSEILIGKNDMHYASSNNPMNREYHEFAHHLMYAEYGSWPAGRTVAGVKNHDGFLNVNTGDSYLEGFAEFMSMAINKEYTSETNDVYAGFGSLENNYKPWDANGYYEELAVASLLWDLYDAKNDEGDTISLTLEDIWKVIKVNRADFYDYYVAFKQENPNKQKEIDALFIAHGFYAYPNEGNKIRDNFEGFRDANGNDIYDVGEFFVDYGTNNVNLIKYASGMDIGKAANYERMNRTSTVRIENAYIKVSNPEVHWYNVNVNLADSKYGADYEYRVDVRDGLIYIHPLPSGYEADITITPESQDYTSQAPFKIKASELNKIINNATKGYIVEHDFKLKSTGKSLDPEYIFESGETLTYEYEGDIGDMEGVELKEGKSSVNSSKSGSGKVLLIIVVILIIISGLFYFTKKKKKHKK